MGKRNGRVIKAQSPADQGLFSANDRKDVYGTGEYSLVCDRSIYLLKKIRRSSVWVKSWISSATKGGAR